MSIGGKDVIKATGQVEAIAMQAKRKMLETVQSNSRVMDLS